MEVGKINTSLTDYEITVDELKLGSVTAPLNYFLIVLSDNNSAMMKAEK